MSGDVTSQAGGVWATVMVGGIGVFSGGAVTGAARGAPCQIVGDEGRFIGPRLSFFLNRRGLSRGGRRGG